MHPRHFFLYECLCVLRKVFMHIMLSSGGSNSRLDKQLMGCFRYKYSTSHVRKYDVIV